MKNILFIIFIFIYHILFERIFFIITAKICGKLSNHDCSKCKCWSCTHDNYSDYQDFIMRDYSKYCGKDL